MDIGHRPEARQEASREYAETIVLKEIGEYLFRIVGGGKRISRVFFPTKVNDEETGKLKDSWQVVQVPYTDNIMTALMTVDKQAQMEQGIENPRSKFYPQDKWLYVVFDRKVEGEFKLAVLEVPKTVWKDLLQLEEKRDVKNPDMLLHGLIFMWDALIEKIKDPKIKSEMRSISYKTEAYTHKWDGRVSAEDLGREVPKEKLAKVFNADELEAIQNCTIDLDKDYIPYTKEEIKIVLMENPVDFDAFQDSKKVFPFPEPLTKEMDKYGLPYYWKGELHGMGETAPEDKKLPEEAPEGKPQDSEAPKQEGTKEESAPEQAPEPEKEKEKIDPEKELW